MMARIGWLIVQLYKLTPSGRRASVPYMRYRDAFPRRRA